jgi:DNA-binding transcriptional ArsR family regulator
MSNDVFNAIADPTRREILRLLSHQEMPVQTLTSRFPISRPAISRHLRILREVGLVTEHKGGRQRFYRLHPERLQEVRDWVLYFDQYWSETLAAFKTFVEERENHDSSSGD